jgi:hypothetical protein
VPSIEHHGAESAAETQPAAGAKAPKAGIWHWSAAKDRQARLAGLDELCAEVAHAGLDYIAFKSNDGADDRFLDDDQLATAQAACAQHGLAFVLWQYVYAVRPPSEEASAFAETIAKFKPPFAFVDVEVEYERAPRSVSLDYAKSFRSHLPHFPVLIAPFGRADLHPKIDWQAWRDQGFGVAPQAYECDSHELTPAACAQSFSTFWPVNEQWTIVGFHKGGLGQLPGAHIAASLKKLPFANISGWYSGDCTVDQLRAIASQPSPGPTPPLPSVSLTTVQQQLIACGFDLEITGQLDDATTEAIRYFQIGWCGLLPFKSPDGQLTPLTRAALAYASRNQGSLGRKAKNFHYQEFRIDNKGDPRVRRQVALAAQAYRDQFGPTTILRSSSTSAHNQAIGGAKDSRHLYPDHWDAIDVSPQTRNVSEVSALGVWTGVGHHAATGFVDHIDLRPGDPSKPNVFPDH